MTQEQDRAVSRHLQPRASWYSGRTTAASNPPQLEGDAELLQTFCHREIEGLSRNSVVGVSCDLHVDLHCCAEVAIGRMATLRTSRAWSAGTPVSRMRTLVELPQRALARGASDAVVPAPLTLDAARRLHAV